MFILVETYSVTHSTDHMGRTVYSGYCNYVGQQVRSSAPGIVPATSAEHSPRVCPATRGDNTTRWQSWTYDYLHHWIWLCRPWQTHRWHAQCRVCLLINCIQKPTGKTELIPTKFVQIDWITWDAQGCTLCLQWANWRRKNLSWATFLSGRQRLIQGGSQPIGIKACQCNRKYYGKRIALFR